MVDTPINMSDNIMSIPNTVITTVTKTNNVYSLIFMDDEIAKIELYSSSYYNYANVGLRKGNDYVSINYEWEGNCMPDFIMDVMSYFMKDSNMATASTTKEASEDFNAFLERLKTSK